MMIAAQLYTIKYNATDNHYNVPYLDLTDASLSRKIYE
jgi:hypothetical protein